MLNTRYVAYVADWYELIVIYSRLSRSTACCNVRQAKG